MSLSYSPRPQFVPFHQRTQRWACLVCHRRMGKTVACVNELGARAIYSQKKDARYAYIAPFYRQAKDVAWQYVKEYLKPIIRKVRESELRVELINGAWITLYGADNPDALRGLYLDGVVLDEFGDCRPSLWGSVILPTLIDRQGWAVFIGTPKGKNQFYDVHMRAISDSAWFSMHAPASTTNIIPHEELVEMATQMSEHEYAREIECSFEAPIEHAIYAKQIKQLEEDGRCGSWPYSPDSPVYASSDIGRKDSTALWFWQERPGGIAIVDYEEHHGEDVTFYDTLVRQKPFHKDLEDWWLPHDAKAKTFSTRKSAIEQLHESGHPVRLTPKLSVHDGIQAARRTLGITYFHTGGFSAAEREAGERVQRGLDALKSYQYRYDEINKVVSDQPLHNWASHGADAFRYLSLIAGPAAAVPVSSTSSPDSPFTTPTHYPFSLDDLWKVHEEMNENWNPDRIH